MHIYRIGTALFCSLACAATAIAAEPAATPAPAWVERSNADAQILLTAMAEFRPEIRVAHRIVGL